MSTDEMQGNLFAENYSLDAEEFVDKSDIAFKILYSTIFFIIASLWILYAYFWAILMQDHRDRDAQRKSKKAIDPTFFDFLAGQLDEQ